jgi:hypothetical protein
MKPKIFEQEQIARAVELGLGASSPAEVEVMPADKNSQDCWDRIIEVLREG